MTEITKKEHNRIMLDMLVEFDKFCKKNSLKYFLAYGTLVGALRHRGFIPWDDDIDVQMPRPDYEKLRKLTKTEKIGDNIEFFDYRSKRCFFDFGKLSDKRTISIDHRAKYKYEPIGVYIDVFVLDGYPDDEEEYKKYCERKREILRYLSLNKAYLKSLTPRKKIKKIILSPVVLNLNLIWNMFDKHAEKYPYETSAYVGNTIRLTQYDIVFKKELYESTIDVEFEGKTFPAPIGYEEILLKIYGIDYRTLPPPEYRVSHHDHTDYWKD